MGNWENETFYRKVHPQGKSQWETGKMVYFMQESVHRGKVGNWENGVLYTKVCAQGKSRWETGKMTHFMEKSTHMGKVDGQLGK
jgi:hypothetical protein